MLTVVIALRHTTFVPVHCARTLCSETKEKRRGLPRRFSLSRCAAQLTEKLFDTVTGLPLNAGTFAGNELSVAQVVDFVLTHHFLGHLASINETLSA